MVAQMQIKMPESIDHEEAILHCMFIGVCRPTETRLSESDFFNSSCRTIFSFAMRAEAAGSDVTGAIPLFPMMREAGVFEMIGGLQYIQHITTGVVCSHDWKRTVKFLKELSRRREAVAGYIKAAHAMSVEQYDTYSERCDAASSEIARVEAALSHGQTSGLRHASEMITGWLDELDERKERKPGEVVGFSTGFYHLDEKLYPKGVLAGALVAIGARPKMGKEQPMHSKILLADGSWTTMGKIAIGDKLASVDGKPSVVTGIFPQGKKKTYRVTFTDGRSAECGIEHLWTIRSSRFKGDRTVNTADIIAMLGKERYQGRITVPSVSGDFGVADDIGLNPWLLGALLGDGGLRGATPKISCSERYIIERVIASLPYGVSMNYDTGVDYRLAGSKGKSNPLAESLKNLGVHGVKSSGKKIPEAVFSSNRKTREMVLAGLLETDGWCEKHNSLMFASSSRDLADGVVMLVRSLGGYAKIRTRTNITYSYKGESRAALDSHIVSIRLADIGIIESPRLTKNLRHSKRSSTPYIESIVESGESECQCIMVDHDSHLYITDDYVVTHNTAFLTKWVNHTALDQGKAACVFSLEMTRTSLLERSIVQRDAVKDMYDGGRLVSRAIQGNDFWDPRVLNGRAGQLADEAYLRSAAIAAEIGNSKLYIDDTPGVSLRHIVSECRRIAKKEGSIGLIAVDYLTLMKAEKAERNDLAYGEITKGLKNLAKEMRCPVLLLTQLNRKLEDRNDKRPMPSDSRDTGQIEQDCDLWIGLFRQAAYTPDGMPGNTSKLAEVIVRLNREGYTGTIYSEFSGGKFSDMDQDEGVRLAGEIDHWLNPAKPEKHQGRIKDGF